MAVEPAAPSATGRAHPTVFVDTFTNGLLGPDVEMLGPVEDGGHVVVNTSPGCWGPMITPALRGGHEVAQPVAVAGAEPGDAIAIRIKDIEVTSIATASGNDVSPEGSFNGDPYCAAVCPGCGTEYPETRLEGIGQEAVRCAECGADATPFKFTNGYTIAFDHGHSMGVTVGRESAERIAHEARALRRAARELGAEPDPRLRAARPRRARRAAAAVHGPARHDAVEDDAGLAQRGRLRLVPDRRAARLLAQRRGARRAPHGRPHGHRRRARRRDPDLPGQAAGRRRLHGRHARAPGRRRDRRPHLRRVGHGHAPGRAAQGARRSTGRSCCRSRRTCPSSPGRCPARSARGPRSSRASGASTGSRSRRRSR